MVNSGIRFAVVLAAVATMATACTSSGNAGSTSSPSASATASTSTPAAAGTSAAAGPGASSSSGRDTYTAPASAPYPTPGRDPSTPATQIGVLTSLPGSASSACYSVGAQRNVRSGSIAMGDFTEARAQFTAHRDHATPAQLNLTIYPEHAKHMTAATVRVDPPGSQRPSTVRTTNIGQAEPYRYFALVLPVRTAGSYRLAVTSGTDHGCFVVSFGQ